MHKEKFSKVHDHNELDKALVTPQTWMEDPIELTLSSCGAHLDFGRVAQQGQSEKATSCVSSLGRTSKSSSQLLASGKLSLLEVGSCLVHWPLCTPVVA